MPQMLNTMTFPLHGARLIEASAGTGKTFTISGLYLRLLLGHGDKMVKHVAPLTVDQILVVTFTEAATAELRERIRAKIHEARIAFLRNKSSDAIIGELLVEVPDHEVAITRLLNAERQMDEAAIFTIHGFCQRMLVQNAFESGSRFNSEFITDESRLKAQVVADYWRRQFYHLSVELAKEVRSIWASPDKLLGEIGGLLSGQTIRLTEKPMTSSLDQLHQDNMQIVASIKQRWLDNVETILAAIEESDVNRRSYSKKNLPAWINKVSDWANSTPTVYAIPDQLEHFRSEVLASKTPESKRVPQHDFFDEISRFLDNKPEIKAPLFAHAVQTCRDALQREKKRRDSLSFDDLLLNLSLALDSDKQGALTERIRTLFPVAMIDEFQDTDPLQYSIFSRIYLPNPETGLFMIGDPKQAIYGFRGADIFTYIRAKNEVTDHYTLGTNWRSSADMIHAVNRLFEQSDAPFMFNKDIPFYPVSPSPKAEQRSWSLGGEAQHALTCWVQESSLPTLKSDYMQQMAEKAACKISQILQADDPNQTYFSDASGRRKISAGEIAVLVRTGHEGQLIRQELAKNGVASVYLSNRDSVFKSPIAVALNRLLLAVIYPEDQRLLRSALACELLMKSSKELDSLNENEVALEAMINEFRSYRTVWQQRGVMPMLRRIMSSEHIAENLLAQDFGERMVTDFLHLSELLQQSSLNLDSEHALVRWFSESIQNAQSGSGSSADVEIQRLESESNLVQIVTIHKSKGLEYGLVFVPFVSAYRESNTGQYHDEKEAMTVVDISKNPDSLALSDRERLAEDLRLLYVALTRAVYGCFIGISPLRKGLTKNDPSGAHLSAIGYLLQNGEEREAKALIESVHHFEQENKDQVKVYLLSESADEIDQQPDNVKGPFESMQNDLHGRKVPSELKASNDLKARQMRTDIDTSWRVTSYSGLIKLGHDRETNLIDVEMESGAQGMDLEPVEESKTDKTEVDGTTIFSFPRGARPGTFLHSLFESIDFTLATDSPETELVIRKLLLNEQYEEKWLPVLQDMTHKVLSTAIDGESLRLNRVASHQKLVEMEFLLPIRHLNAVMHSQLSKNYDPISSVADSLGFSDVQGMLKGFIDLIFVYEGKYYVLDWKSNHLGNDVADYSRESIEKTMGDHRYDFQYQIYTLALHRFLRSRIPDYHYQTHFGGVYYLFLRGVDEKGNGIFYTRPDLAFVEGFDALIGDKAEVDHA